MLLSCLFWALLAIVALPAIAAPNETYKVGFLARDSEGPDKSEFAPTISALNQELKSRSRTQRLSLVALDYEDVLPEVQAKQVDFLIVDPELYVLTEDLGTTAIASLRRRYQGQEVASYGGVIFGVDGRCKLSADGKRLEGRVAAVRATSYDGFGMQKAELARRGITWQESDILFTDAHSAVVDNVVAKNADCGFARTGTLEQFAKAWKFKISRFQGFFLDGQGQRARYIMSTPSTTEWPFAALAHVDPSIVEVVSIGLGNVKPHANPRFKDETLRWAYPLSYAAARARRERPADPSVEIPAPAEPAPAEPAEPAPAEPATDALVEAGTEPATDAPPPEPTGDPVEAEPLVASPVATPRDPPVELFVVLGVLFGLVLILVGAAYLVGRSAGFARGLASDDWGAPPERSGVRERTSVHTEPENSDL